MPVYRYKQGGLNITDVKEQVPPADASSVSSGSAALERYWDITAPTTSKDDLDTYMAKLGWSFDSTDPSTTPAEAAQGDVDHTEIANIGTNTHAQLDSHVASTSNPHSVTAAQTGAATLTSTSPVNVTKAAAAVGVGTTAARHDHKHDVTTAAPGATGVATASGEGSATTLARSDHTHQSNTAPANVTKAAAAIGTSGQPARADHKHDITTAVAVAVGTANAEGNATSLARSNHTHQVTGLTIASQAQGDILYRNASAWVRLAAGTNNQVLTTKGAGANPVWANGGLTAAPHRMFQADQMESPNSSDWAVNALAPLIPDANNTALSVRAFDDTTVEGIGFTVRVPAGATNIILGFLSRAASTPAGSVNVGLNLYKRAIPDNSAIPVWGSATALTNLAFTTNVLYQKDSQTIAISTLGLTVGVTYTFELCRNVPTDTLVGDWLLHSLTVGWS